MAETAKILSPQKTVLIPEPNAGCPMADMITREQLLQLKKEHPKAKVICYVNTSAEVKAECDYCCTSANAIEMLENAFDEDDEILFVPDKYLASYAASKTNRNVIIWQGYCPTHVRILPEYIQELRKLHPESKVMVHPECSGPVIQIADQVLSTSGMLRYAKESSAKEFIVGTEVEMVYPLSKENPDKIFYPATDLAVCPNMKKTTLEKVEISLKNIVHEIILPQEIIERAKKPIDNMIKFKKNAQATKK